MKLAVALSSPDVITSTYVESVVPLTLLIEPEPTHVDFAFNTSALTVVKSPLAGVYPIRISTVLTSSYGFKVAKSIVGTSTILSKVTQYLSGIYPIEKKIQVQLQSLCGLKLQKQLIAPSLFLLKQAYPVSGQYEIKKRLTSPLICPYSVVVSNRCVGMSNFTTLLKSPIAGVYAISKQVRQALTISYPCKVAQTVDLSSQFSTLVKYPITGFSTFIVTVKSPTTAFYNILTYTLIRKSVTAVYNISSVNTRGITTIHLVKF